MPKRKLPVYVRREAEAHAQEALNLALIHHARKMHAASEEGYSRDAFALTGVVFGNTVQPHPSGYMLWCKIRLSDGALYRACYLRSSPEGALLASWRRVPWSWGYRPSKQSEEA